MKEAKKEEGSKERKVERSKSGGKEGIKKELGESMEGKKEWERQSR